MHRPLDEKLLIIQLVMVVSGCVGSFMPFESREFVVTGVKTKLHLVLVILRPVQHFEQYRKDHSSSDGHCDKQSARDFVQGLQ